MTENMNPKVMEVWLNDVLMDAEVMGIPTLYVKGDKRKAIS